LVGAVFVVVVERFLGVVVDKEDAEGDEAGDDVCWVGWS
jgi:hypothetical protein